MEIWLKERLSTCLDFPIPDEMIKYILSMKSTREIDEYFQTLLNYDLPEHKIFINDFKQKFFEKSNNNGGNKQNAKKQSKNNVVENKKDKLSTEISSNQNQSLPSTSSTTATATTTTAKKKTKFVNLYTKDGQMNDVVLLKGRHRCDCQAEKHKLINNCMKCGRIVCEQEGSGPCLFCGELVCSEDELKLIRTSTKKGDNLKKSLMEQNRPKGWEEALAQRNRLLEYNRTSERRTTVIDDESDYFNVNSVWLSDAERKKLEILEEEMREKKHSRRSNQKITIDFAGREIIEEPQLAVDFEDHILKEIAKSVSNGHNITSTKKEKKNKNQSNDIHPNLDLPAPIYISIRNPNKNDEGEAIRNEYDGVYNRVQDKELLEIQDMRHCLSMHQPWASLLIAGIKKHEGRTWYTSHRGRLWIASTAKVVDMDDVKRMENFYRVICKDDNIKFPSQYPSGCLLGCVSVEDCLPQEEYRKVYPDGESDSPFVFICTNPQELPIRFPVKGSHKIYKLDPKIHMAAVKSLQRISKLKAETDA